jgi:hypothetical protein
MPPNCDWHDLLRLMPGVSLGHKKRNFRWGAIMVHLRIAAIAALIASIVGPAYALDWEIERNFRYFEYPSDVALHRVAREIYAAKHQGSEPTPAELEAFINDQDFWSLPLANAGDSRKAWPLSWPRDDTTTTLQLISTLRSEEGNWSGIPRRSPPKNPEEMRRLGWASLLAPGPNKKQYAGATDTCWDPLKHIHSNCSLWGDYVRPSGWVVRVFDSGAPATSCHWQASGAVFADGPTPSQFVAKTRAARAQASPAQATADCREAWIIVPSQPADPHAVSGSAEVRRTGPDGQPVTITVKPSDKLVIGFGDSFTSGEGNPERPAVFNGDTWADVAAHIGEPSAFRTNVAANFPARGPDRKDAQDTRAQWTDRWCHRSVYSWQIRSSLDAALRDNHQSITVLPYGCSGASIMDGMLYAWGGVESGAPTTGVIGSNAEIGLAYQELCADFAGPTHSIDWSSYQNQEGQQNFYKQAVDRARRDVARCGAKKANAVKRSADALLIDIGINDVGFSKWVMGLILDDGIRQIAQGLVPCVDQNKNPCDTTTIGTFKTLNARFTLLGDVLKRFLIPEFGLDPSHVVAAIYPPELSGCGADDGDHLSGNVGLTVATQQPSIFGAFPLPIGPNVDPAACQNGGLALALVGHGGTVAALRDLSATKDVENARKLLNDDLGKFVSGLGTDNLQAVLLSVLDTSGDFHGHGFCATHDHDSQLPNGQQCFTTANLTDYNFVRCADHDPPSNPESQHLPQPIVQIGMPNCPNSNDIHAFHPFVPGRYEPYRSRTRLFRTMNDVFMTINERPPQQIDAAYGLLDLTNRASSGAFHPTAEGHAIVAGYAADSLCNAIGCNPE